MYFPTGWPKVLRSLGATSGRPVKIFRHRTKNFVVELRERSVAFWHTRLGILVAAYICSTECVEKHGVNVNATLKPDGSAVVIATSNGHLLFLRVHYERPLPSDKLSYVTREHGILLQQAPNLEVVGEGMEVEGVTMKYFHETAVVGGVVSLFCVGSQLVVATGYGVLHRLNWEGRFDSSLAIHLNQVPLANDLLPESRGQPLGEIEVCPCDVVYSPELHGFSVVLGDGRAIFMTAKSAKYEPQSLQGVWIKGLSDAVCTAVNVRYRLLAFGKKNGTVDVFSADDVAGVWNLSHTLQFTRRQFPETGVQLGAVQCMEWSHDDGMVIAVSWKNGGLSLWSVFGCLLLCSLGDQPGTPSPLNPHCTILESLCWSLDGYHLWMLPIDTRTKKRLETPKAEGTGSGQEEPANNPAGCQDNNGQVLVMRFLKNSIVNNPVTSNHSHLFLQGSDRLYLNSSKSVVCSGNQGNHGNQEGSGASNNGVVSSPQWRVLQLPTSYLVMNWPIKYAAISPGGVNVAVAGKAGFALYSGFKRKWKLFGNEVQEQSLVCRGGLLWYRDMVVFPCRVQERTEEVRFYSLHSNLDNSQLMQTIKLTSPVVKINLHGNHLLLGSRDCHLTIYSLNIAFFPNKAPILSVVKLHELSLAKSLPQPWANTLIAMVPSNVRTEPSGSQKDGHRPVDSILFNISGRLLMIQQDLLNPYLPHQEEWSFSPPVCIAQAVEIVWIPSPLSPTLAHTEDHLMESLWLASGSSGIKVWLPLYPRDEAHPTFLSKRIMLTLPITVYPQAVLFRDAVLFGLSHETAFTGTSFTSKHSFPFATTERTTHVFLHHILRQLLRRNLGSHALQMARSCSHLPYFAHVLELMLHEILEEEAPGAMPVPDALLPRVVEFIKQFPEFLETVGSCARKTEVALWQYLFAAVGNPRDLFELCISDGRLKTAASYLIIIQNLEASTVSRQLATRLLDAALDNNQWELCKDLVRFLRAIGPGDIDSPSPSGTVTPATPFKTPTHTPAASTTAAATSVGTPSSLSAPDLDRSAMSVTRDHLSSGSTSSVLSLSGDFRDASGKVIRRPQFVMDVDSREEYFMELILSRHARKLLTARCLQDLGKFAAHLDFSLHNWLTRERLRAARIEDFVATLRELHKQFQWPFPSYLPNHKPLTRLHEDLETPLFNERGARKEEGDALTPGAQSSKGTLTPTAPFSPELENLADSLSDSASVASSSIKRARRPPDLDLSPSQNTVDLAPDATTSGASVVVTMETTSEKSGGSSTNAASGRSSTQVVNGGGKGVGGPQGEFDPTRCSTPSRRSGSVSERVSLVLKQHPSSSDLQVDASSLGDIMEESDWDLSSDVAMVTTPGLKGSAQAEKEIRYFVEVTLAALCIEWTVVLGVLLLDVSVLTRTVESVRKQGGVEGGVFARIVQGVEEIHSWAESECTGYLHFLDLVHPHFEQLKSLAQHSPRTPLSQSTEEVDIGVTLTEDSTSQQDKSSPKVAGSQDQEGSVCVVS